jgi:hypothetical protein
VSSGDSPPPSPLAPANSSSSSEEENDGGGGLRGGIPRPVTTGCGVGTRGGRGGTRHQVINGGARERHGGAGERHGSVGGRNSGAPRTLEEEEAGLLQLEVSSTSLVRL